jgi:phage head maturation protease
VAELVQRGDIKGSSFMFKIADGGQRWEEQEDKTYKRYISKFASVRDMGPVDNPAYPDTTAAKRDLDEFISKNSEEEKLKNEEKRNLGKSLNECLLDLHR